MTIDERGVNGWNVWAKRVLGDLERIEAEVVALRDEIAGIKTDIALLKLKSSLWGALGGVATAAIVMATAWLTRKP